tara:strand:- start:718 stop:1089 length:372 start_codon:yes stop_codon:yes gene_type:complete
MSNFSHQDWKPVVFHNPNANKKKQPVVKRSQDEESARLRKLENDEIQAKTITKDVKLAIQQARCNLKMSQKQLAAALSIPTDTITKYENGKAVPNNALLNRMQRILKVKLTGKDIGQSIPDKK